MSDRDPRHGLEAIALLAYLYADEDGHHGPDPVRDILADISRRADDARSPNSLDEESALALVSCALDLLNAAECDVPTGTKGAARRIRKAIRLLEDGRDRLRPRTVRTVHADAKALRKAAEDIWPDLHVYDGRERALRRMVERIVGPVEWSAPLPSPEPAPVPVPEFDPDEPF